MNRFHLAFKVTDIESTYDFYHRILGCKIGRSTADWIDFDFFGNQLSAHVSNDIPTLDYCGKVDNIAVPIPHFGCILHPDDFKKIEKTFKENNIEFVVKPQLRYQNTSGEQRTMFVLDFSNNPIEFKTYTNEQEIFETH